MREVTGIFMEHKAISPEVERAQRMAELEQIAKYRATRMAQYADWVKPENIAARKREHEAGAAKALEMGKAMAAIAAEQIAQKKLDEQIKKPHFNIIPIYKPIKRKWYQFILDWFK